MIKDFSISCLHKIFLGLVFNWDFTMGDRNLSLCFFYVSFGKVSFVKSKPLGCYFISANTKTVKLTDNTIEVTSLLITFLAVILSVRSRYNHNKIYIKKNKGKRNFLLIIIHEPNAWKSCNWMSTINMLYKWTPWMNILKNRYTWIFTVVSIINYTNNRNGMDISK